MLTNHRISYLIKHIFLLIIKAFRFIHNVLFLRCCSSNVSKDKWWMIWAHHAPIIYSTHFSQNYIDDGKSSFCFNSLQRKQHNDIKQYSIFARFVSIDTIITLLER